MKTIVLTDWRKSQAYLSDGTVKCAGFRCERVIPVGEWYTRAKPRAAIYSWAVHPFCRNCRPFYATPLTQAELMVMYDGTEFGKSDRKNIAR